MKWKIAMISMLVLVQLMACQRFKRSEERTGLDNDSHSYSYVSYPESKMKTAAYNVQGVQDIIIEYDKRNQKLMAYVIPSPRVPTSDYRRIAIEVEQKMRANAPLNPVHVKVITAQDYYSKKAKSTGSH